MLCERWRGRLLIGLALAVTASLATGCRGTRPLAAPPDDHGPAFDRQHGHAQAADCADCHGPSPCAGCHRSRPPTDHGPLFGGPQHGPGAASEPARCATCHGVSECMACHGR